MSGTTVGSVGTIGRFPVKSMLGEQLGEAVLEATGLVGDRAYALVDGETGKVVSVKRPKRWGRIFELAAATGPGGVAVVFRDGTRIEIGDPDLPVRLSSFFGRAVSIASIPPAGATFDEVWLPELKNDVPPYFDLPTRDDGDEVDLVEGGQFMSAAGNFFNYGAIHLVTTGTCRRLAELAPGSRFDAWRFRPNLVVETEADGFLETDWPGRTLRIGDVELAVSFTVPRCVMTTLEQGDLPADPDVLRTISRHNTVDCFGSGTRYPCVGAYADVTAAGRIERGQPVVLV